MIAIADDEDTLQLAREIMEEISPLCVGHPKEASHRRDGASLLGCYQRLRKRNIERMVSLRRLTSSLRKLQPTLRPRNTDLLWAGSPPRRLWGGDPVRSLPSVRFAPCRKADEERSRD